MSLKLFIFSMCVFMWMGFICAISFMEAWLKFRAPGVTVPIGLGIGKLVFGALNKVEWVFALAILGILLAGKYPVPTAFKVWYGIAVLFPLAQSFWLLPVLDNRADALIRGESLHPSPLHIYFVLLEIFKVLALFLMARNLFHSLSGSPIAATGDISS
jgi:hypothetical protein